MGKFYNFIKHSEFSFHKIFLKNRNVVIKQHSIDYHMLKLRLIPFTNFITPGQEVNSITEIFNSFGFFVIVIPVNYYIFPKYSEKLELQIINMYSERVLFRLFIEGNPSFININFIN